MDATVFLQYLRGAVLILALAYVVKYFVEKKRIFILGNKLPGPKAWPIVGNALEFAKNDLDVLDKLWKYNQKYGLVRLWLGPMLNVFICSAEDAEIYYSSPALYDRSKHFEFLKPLIGHGLVTANGSYWRRTKKLMEPSFRYSTLRSFGPILQEKTDILIQLLEKEAGKPVFSVYTYIKNCNFDIITKTMCDMEINAQTQTVEILRHIDDVLAHITSRMHSIWQQSDLLYNLSAIGKDFYRKTGLIHKYVEDKVVGLKKSVAEIKRAAEEEDCEGNFKRKPFAVRLIEQGEWNDDEIRDHLITMVSAGFETSTNATCFALVLLGIHQDVQEKLYQEILSAAEDGLNDYQLERLEYLDKVIRETMRIFPIGAILFREAKEDVQFGKNLVPKGAAVGINIFAIHRNPKYYDNPNVFNPENFSKENIDNRHPFAFVPFGAGMRRCIGEKLAWMTMRIFITKILLNYKIESDLKLEDVKIRVGITLRMEDRYPIRLIKRHPMKE